MMRKVSQVAYILLLCVIPVIWLAPFVFACLGLQGGFGVGPKEYRHISYQEFRKLVGDDEEFDPVGATEISFAYRAERDSWDRLMVVQIEEVAFQTLLETFRENLQQRDAARHWGCPKGTLKMFLDENEGPPDGWRHPRWRPDWWDVPSSGRLTRVCWKLHCNERAQDWYWVYNHDESQLHAWENNP